MRRAAEKIFGFLLTLRRAAEKFGVSFNFAPRSGQNFGGWLTLSSSGFFVNFGRLLTKVEFSREIALNGARGSVLSENGYFKA